MSGARRVAALVPRAGQCRHGLQRTVSHPDAEGKGSETRENDHTQRVEKKRKRVTTAGKRATTAGQSGTTAGERGDSQLESKSIPNRRERVDMDKISFQPKLQMLSQDNQS